MRPLLPVAARAASTHGTPGLVDRSSRYTLADPVLPRDVEVLLVEPVIA